VAGAAAGVAANLALAAWAPGVSWLWWNVSGCAVALAAGVALGRGKQPVAPLASERGTRRQALLLVAYFGLIVSLLALITVSV
jgi:hypothetical protein